MEMASPREDSCHNDRRGNRKDRNEHCGECRKIYIPLSNPHQNQWDDVQDGMNVLRETAIIHLFEVLKFLIAGLLLLNRSLKIWRVLVASASLNLCSLLLFKISNIGRGSFAYITSQSVLCRF